MNEWPFVSVVVPMRNEEQYIAQCLRSLIDQDYPEHRYEVLVIDGCSEDRSKQIVAELSAAHPYIRLLGNPSQVVTTALNKGLHEAKGEIIVRVDAHCFVARDFLRRSVECLERTMADCVGGPLEYVGNSFQAKAIGLALSSPFGVGNALFRYSKREGYVDTVAFGAYRKEVFDRVGLFDEELIRSEDNDLHFRIRESGGKIFLTPKIKCYYHNRSSLTDLWKQQFQNGLWTFRTVRKSPGSLSLRHYVPLMFLISILASLGLSLLNSQAIFLFYVIMLSYTGVSLFFSMAIAFENGWKYFFMLPIVFACLHFRRGFGSIISLGREGLSLLSITQLAISEKT